MYYSFCGVDGVIEFHNTLEEAKARVEVTKDWLEHDAADSDWAWNEGGPNSTYGKVLGKIEYKDRDLAKEEKIEHPEWDAIRECVVEEIPSIN